MTSQLDATLARLDDQTRWYDKKSQQNKRWRTFFGIGTIALALIATVLTCIYRDWIIAILSAAIAFLQSLEAFFQNEYNWLNYRSNCETLKHEKALFDSKSGPYADTDDPARLLAERIEGVISHEHASWISVHDSKGRFKSGLPSG